MGKIGIAILIAAAALAVVVMFGGMGRDGGETGQDSANPHAIQQE
ncbi:hypothetical protein [Rhodobacter sp. SGA-6-6]|nr:hypothetical protein [Rhodobacter sp. SGA-6-6]